MPEPSPAKSSGYALDVMVPTHNHLELTITCLQALYQYTRTPFHLIITDSSSDLTPLYLTQFCKEHDNVTYIHTETGYRCGNQFFNKALEHCKTPFMATVMNSVRVEPDWEVGGLQLMASDPKIGMVGFKCLLSNGTIESAGIKMMKYLPCDMGRGLPGHWLSLSYEVDVSQWAFALLRKEAVMGNLDENIFYGHRGWDDIDNCFVLKKAGWKIFYCGAGVGYHSPRATRGEDSEQADKENGENGKLFYQRWGLLDKLIAERGPNASVHRPPKSEEEVRLMRSLAEAEETIKVLKEEIRLAKQPNGVKV